MKNIKYTVTHPIFVFMKKHFCPHCKAALTVETAHHLVNSRSEEAKNYDFSTDRKSTRLNSSHRIQSRMPSSA